VIWNDSKISAWAASGGVTPFDGSCVNPASLDLRLGNKIRLPKRKWATHSCAPIDMRTPATELWDDELIFDSIVIPSGGVALCCSLEYIRMPEDASGTLMSKSSTGRRLLEHLHAGFFDPSFAGNGVFEFFNNGPWDIRLSAGDKLVQIKMEQMIEVPKVSYQVIGHYNGQVGATAHVVVSEYYMDPSGWIRRRSV